MNKVKYVMKKLMEEHPEYYEELREVANVYDSPLTEFMMREAVYRLREIHEIVLEDELFEVIADDVFTEYWNSDFFLDYSHIDYLTIETIKKHAKKATTKEEILEVISSKGIFWLNDVSQQVIENIVGIAMEKCKCNSLPVYTDLVNELSILEFLSWMKLENIIKKRMN